MGKHKHKKEKKHKSKSRSKERHVVDTGSSGAPLQQHSEEQQSGSLVAGPPPPVIIRGGENGTLSAHISPVASQNSEVVVQQIQQKAPLAVTSTGTAEVAGTSGTYSVASGTEVSTDISDKNSVAACTEMSKVAGLGTKISTAVNKEDNNATSQIDKNVPQILNIPAGTSIGQNFATMPSY